jgi:thiosulfate/3-mercaptopyruvate sulfurtransferase
MSTPFVSAEWLSQHLDDPQVAIADCRFSLADPELGQHQYQAAHLPGAYYFDLNRDLSGSVEQHGGRHPLPNPMVLAAKLAKAGINSGNNQEPTLLVVYDDSRLSFAARCWWLLHYLGHDRVAVLDGGFSNWQLAGYPVTKTVPLSKLGHFVPQIRSNRVVDIETVKALKDLPEVALVDSRESERYYGEREPIDPIAGHIPGAVNYPWQDVTDTQGYIRPKIEQQKRWEPLMSYQEMFVYCGSGVTACVNLLSLELAGISTAKLYAGSWSDWCSHMNKV